MKKFFLFAVVGMVASAVQASYLYWQVSPEPQSQNMGTTINAEGARVVAVKGDESIGLVSSYDAGGGHLEKLADWVETRVYDPETGEPLYVEGSHAYGAQYVIDLDQLEHVEDYSFYIEFARYDEVSGQIVTTGFSDTTFTDGPKTYAQLESAGFIDAQLTPGVPAYWHGDGYVTPEPTSGLLVLIGLGLLGLKRRRVVLKA